MQKIRVSQFTVNKSFTSAKVSLYAGEGMSERHIEVNVILFMEDQEAIVTIDISPTREQIHCIFANGKAVSGNEERVREYLEKVAWPEPIATFFGLA